MDRALGVCSDEADETMERADSEMEENQNAELRNQKSEVGSQNSEGAAEDDWIAGLQEENPKSETRPAATAPQRGENPRKSRTLIRSFINPLIHQSATPLPP